MNEFEVTKEHLALVQELNIGWSDEYYDGAPMVDSKRPFGNSDVSRDIIETLHWENCFDEYGDIKEASYDAALKIYRELEYVLQILTSNLSIQPGVYFKKKYAYKGWELKGETK